MVLLLCCFFFFFVCVFFFLVFLYFLTLRIRFCLRRARCFHQRSCLRRRRRNWPVVDCCVMTHLAMSQCTCCEHKKNTMVGLLTQDVALCTQCVSALKREGLHRWVMVSPNTLNSKLSFIRSLETTPLSLLCCSVCLVHARFGRFRLFGLSGKDCTGSPCLISKVF